MTLTFSFFAAGVAPSNTWLNPTLGWVANFWSLLLDAIDGHPRIHLIYVGVKV